MAPTAHRIIRVALFLAVAGGLGLLNHRLRRTPEQLELTRYVERDLPALLAEEHAIAESLSSLLDDKKLPAPAARARVVDEIMPRLIRTRRRAEGLELKTVTVRQLAAAYLIVLDGWSEAARSAVRAIDDAGISTEAAVASVRERLADAARAAQAWRARLVETCAHEHLAPPPAAPLTPPTR